MTLYFRITIFCFIGILKSQTYQEFLLEDYELLKGNVVEMKEFDIDNDTLKLKKTYNYQYSMNKKIILIENQKGDAEEPIKIILDYDSINRVTTKTEITLNYNHDSLRTLFHFDYGAYYLHQTKSYWNDGSPKSVTNKAIAIDSLDSPLNIVIINTPDAIEHNTFYKWKKENDLISCEEINFTYFRTAHIDHLYKEYDEHGNMTLLKAESSTLDRKHKKIILYYICKYKYDQYGNWIERRIKGQNGKEYITVRNYVYQDSQ